MQLQAQSGRCLLLLPQLLRRQRRAAVITRAARRRSGACKSGSACAPASHLTSRVNFFRQALRLVGDTTAFQFRCIPHSALLRLQLRLVFERLHHCARNIKACNGRQVNEFGLMSNSTAVALAKRVRVCACAGL
jgi:hypothetical protein